MNKKREIERDLRRYLSEHMEQALHCDGLWALVAETGQWRDEIPDGYKQWVEAKVRQIARGVIT